MNRKCTNTVRVDETVELRENESDWVDRKLLENRVKGEENFGYHDFVSRSIDF